MSGLGSMERTKEKNIEQGNYGEDEGKDVDGREEGEFLQSEFSGPNSPQKYKGSGYLNHKSLLFQSTTHSQLFQCSSCGNHSRWPQECRPPFSLDKV